jgi:hypothetical protein
MDTRPTLEPHGTVEPDPFDALRPPVANGATLARACDGPVLAKTITPAGAESVRPGRCLVFAEAGWGEMLSGIGDIFNLLRRLEDRPHVAVLRGAVIDPANAVGVRRLLHPDPESHDPATICDAGRRWMALDVDNLPAPPGLDLRDVRACGMVARRSLPMEFRHAGCVVQATASHGLLPGLLRLRAWCWLSRPVSCTEACRWLRVCQGSMPRFLARPN